MYTGWMDCSLVFAFQTTETECYAADGLCNIMCACEKTGMPFAKLATLLKKGLGLGERLCCDLFLRVREKDLA